ncbi:unnamed protein product [Linum tenue]|uniref:phospholipase A2 n=1 Tax=Linum tenue TaxID=586396 RepID=A0AAV0S770_9ROSI|nr:unnamed protein product [Linum tenue]
MAASTNLVSCSFLLPLLPVLFSFFSTAVDGLTVGVQAIDRPGGVVLSKECSRKCESEFCSVPPFLRYGKYCGLLYSGCPGEKPCDGLDSCCMNHDLCVQSKNSAFSPNSFIIFRFPFQFLQIKHNAWAETP